MTFDPNGAFGDRVIQFKRREPTYVHVRRLWTFRGPTNVDVTADVYRTDTGFELYVERNGDFYLAERYTSIQNAERRAEQLAGAMTEQGFTRMPNDRTIIRRHSNGWIGSATEHVDGTFSGGANPDGRVMPHDARPRTWSEAMAAADKAVRDTGHRCDERCSNWPPA